MVKKIIMMVFFITSISCFVAAEDAMRQDKLLINLIFPGSGDQAMKAPRSIPKPIEVSGQIFLDISPAPSNVRKGRYVAEYFFDDQLIYKTTGFDNAANSSVGFGFIFDTTKHENGRYKLVVNFWDQDGQSAIGVRDVIISNRSGE
ncbi:MAG: hypothetical protein NT033_00335 [Candidatus Omnitrophica bacterium]|nr:hypothetical protein [Candidatus Omnitrophota bacterium]